MRVKKILGVLACLLFILSVLATPVLAKGGGFGGGRGGGFSGGGRSSFSTAPRGASSFGRTSPSYSSKAARPGGVATNKSGGAAATSPSAPEGAGTSYGKGFATKTEDFSTPRQANPPTLYKDYGTGKGDYSTGRTSYSTGRPSYNGTWDRSAVSENDRFPQKQAIGVYGAPPQPPYYYNNYYWGMPFWYHLFFQPNYYYTPWGYHYYAPRLLTWIILLGALGLGGLFLYSSLRRWRY